MYPDPTHDPRNAAVTSTLGIKLLSTRGERGVVGDGDGADDRESEEARTKSGDALGGAPSNCG